MTASLYVPSFPTFLKFPLGGAQQALDRVKRASMGGALGGAGQVGAGLGVQGKAAVATNWWEAGGATGCVAAYQPKGAASLAASYVNRANPGTDNASPGVAPTWDATNGWIFNGATQYLNAVSFVADQTATFIVRWTGWAAGVVYGFYQDYASNVGAYIYPNGVESVNGDRRFVATNAPALAAGVYCVAGRTCYRNGVAESSLIPNAPRGETVTPYIGALYTYSSPTPTASYFFDGEIQGLAVYNNVLTAGQVAAVSAAMAAL